MALLDTLASVVGLEVDELVGRVRKNAAIFGLLGFFALVAVVFLLVALNVVLTGLYGPLWAPLIIAGAGAACALILYLVYAAIEASAKRRMEAERRLAAERTALVTTVASTALPLLAKSPKLVRMGLPIGVAVAAAYLLMREWSRDDASGPADPGDADAA